MTRRQDTKMFVALLSSSTNLQNEHLKNVRLLQMLWYKIKNKYIYFLHSHLTFISLRCSFNHLHALLSNKYFFDLIVSLVYFSNFNLT